MMNFEKIIETAILLLPGLIIGLTVHEAAHAITAKWLGDRTSEKMGRVSLNPMRHLSLYGTLALFFLHFGWGKPVIVNLYNFKKPKFYYLLSSLAGPASNLIICGISLAILHMQPHPVVFNFLIGVFLINGMLAAINLVPIPPLDGSKIWPCLIPGMKPTISGKWSMIWIVVLIVSMQTGGIGKVLGPIQDGMWSLIPKYEKTEQPQLLSERPEGFPEVLAAPENAFNVYYSNYPEKTHSLQFKINESLTGVESYNYIEQRLRKFGWRKLKYDIENPEKIHESKWRQPGKSEQSTTENSAKIYYSDDYWCNRSGEMIIVSRSYMSDGDDSNNDEHFFSVFLLKDPSQDWPDYLEYRKAHPEEFEEILGFGE